jgi:N-acetylmuramoyl-L-alanine amidase
MKVALVPSDFPQRLAARGLNVHVFGDWSTCGSSADHRAVVLHHTASGSSTRPEDDAAYCHHGKGYPLYNVLIDRIGDAWVLARERSESSGDISSVALNEALGGRAGSVSAAERGLRDDTSANSRLFAISAQNNGVGEPWSDALVDGMAVAGAVACECLELPHAGYVTQHRVLTARKVDCCGDSVPYDLQARVAHAMRGTSEVPEMWVLNGEVPAGTDDEPGDLYVSLPYGYKTARVDFFLDADHGEGASLWSAQLYEGGAGAVGLWSGGHQWDLWLPGKQRSNTSAELDPSAHIAAIRVQNRGPNGPVLVTVSGT